MSKIKFGVIREGKQPSDSRVPLTPKHCRELLDTYGDQAEVYVQSSEVRCIKDAEYEAENIPVVDDVSDCDVLLGVKEVPIDELVEAKTYLFFSHTHKKQVYNRKLLKAMLDKRIRMIDYECLTYENGARIIGFGRYAGIVGAHNGMQAYGRRTGAFELKAAYDAHDFEELIALYQTIDLPAFKIAITGTGRVAKGAKEVLEHFDITEVSAEDYLNKEYDEAVFTKLDLDKFYAHSDGRAFDKYHFYGHPEEYIGTFEPYTKVTDLFINGIYWDNKAPQFFTLEDMKSPDFKISVIADITCDIAPTASVPSTLKATVIGDPVFGFNPQTSQEDVPYQEHVIDVMSIDNLPNELPRDASKMFGTVLLKMVVPELLKTEGPILDRANICRAGQLTAQYDYLSDFVKEA